jgi:hypothetical protein
MGLISKEVEVSLGGKNIKHYENLGYEILRRKGIDYKISVKRGTKLTVKVEDLSKGSNVKVIVKCDCPDCKNPYLKPMRWQTYERYVREDGTYYCNKCVKQFTNIKALKTKLKNSKSFEQWCIENNKEDVLSRWDYELNKCKPSEVFYSSNKKYYFLCHRNIHKSELHNINKLTWGSITYFKCRQCNSFAQWGIDNIGDDFLEEYWDFDKNILNPWELDFSCKKLIWIKCKNKDYHGSYNLYCNAFVHGTRCPYCFNNKIHPLDSLGSVFPRVLDIWSDKNEKTPYEYSPHSGNKAWFKCMDKKHEDYYKNIANASNNDFRCPKCQYSKGETKIEEILINKNVYFIPQKEYDNLMGVSNGNLSYDFYLPQYNLLIEYQGEFHDGTAWQQSEKEFEVQQEHDRRKREYAKINNIKLLEIWYYDFKRLELILYKELNL